MADLDWTRIEAARESKRLSRAEYEAACAALGIAPWTDEKIVRDAYGLRYGEYHTEQPIVEQALGMRRLLTMELEAKAAQPAPAPVAMAVCARCGEEVPAVQVMASSVDGRVCPTCYDEVEASV